MKSKHISAIISLLLALLLLAACGGVPDSTVPTWQEQYDLGMRYLSQGNYQEAVIAFQAAIEIDPRNADAHVGLGQAHIGLGEHQAAASAFRAAIEIDPGLVDAYLGLADAYVGLGDIDAAIDALREGYELSGDERLLRRLEELEASGGAGAGGNGQTGSPESISDTDAITVKATIIYNAEAYSEQYESLVSMYRTDSHGVGIGGFGIRFSEPIHMENGDLVTEAQLVYDRSLEYDIFGTWLRGDGELINEEIINTEILVTGYLEFNDDHMELEPNTGRYHDTVLYVFWPNGPYVFRPIAG